MTTIITDLKNNFRRGNIAVQLIYINVALFVLTLFLSVLLQLFNLRMPSFSEWLGVSASITTFLMRPWTLVTYMFMHVDFLHILFNMLWLYWFGTLFLQIFSAKHLRGLYLLGGICGGVLYMLSFNIFPYFHPLIDFSYMVGASASVLAIVAASAYRLPEYPIQLFLFGTIRLKYLALIVIIVDVLFVTSANGGGHIAHLGGALAGLWFAAALQKGKDVTAWLNKAIDALIALFDKKEKPRMKVKQGGRRQEYDYNARKKEQNAEIDRILEKLKESGYESLTTEEKKSLFDASKR
ncbi:MAG: rhomboid family intramembrane serine protease [Mediterranea massiliensis]|nr:rhomboid family intramembrane serine protease [Mediterranea massiliensis]